MSDIPGDISRLDLLAVLQALASGVSIANTEGRIVFSNDAANRILGTLPSDKPAGEWAAHYGVLLPGTGSPFPEDRYPLVRALAGEEIHDVEMLVRNPATAGDVMIESSARPLRDESGSITGAVVVFRDVTRLREAQRALEQSNRDLMEAHRLKDELAAFVAHDLKGPLTTVMALSDMILTDDEQAAASIREDVGEIRAAAERMHRMVMDLLDVQLGEDGSLRLQLESVGVHELVSTVAKSLAPRAPGIVVEPIAHPLTATADPSLLFRVVANLVDNCVKYGPRGGRISISVPAANGPWVRICVEDEGPGVPDDLRESIFDKYAQAERVRGGRSIDSRGLGLRFCRVVVDAHGGRIWVEDAEPTGARFCLELPAHAQTR